ncbi:MAG TPA: hypothetical protein VFX35_12365 [Solirubrobacterales bacterium]|nr:hypothetical protein [Solirubrobacterales bacterium]
MKHVKIPALVGMAIAALMALAAAPASATEIYSGATTLKSGTAISASLSGTASLTTTGGTALDTCTGGGVTGITTNDGGASGVSVAGTVEKSYVTWTGCTKKTQTLEGGTLEINWKEGLNGTVTGKGFKVTVEMIAEFGGTCSYTLGAGKGLGTLVGSTTSNATLAINAVVTGASGNSFLCPEDTKWVANYKVTSPSPLHATNVSGTELYSGATTLGAGSTISASMSGSATLAFTDGTLIETCTGGSASGEMSNSGGENLTVTGKVSKSGLTWTGCSKTMDTLEGGELTVTWTEGLNGVVTGRGFKVTMPLFGESCSYTLGTGKVLGTLVGSTTANATLAINAIVNGAEGNSYTCPSDLRWTANYHVTSPKLLHVTNS